MRDAEIVVRIRVAREHRFRVRFGAHKMWLHLRTQRDDVTRRTAGRLMAAQGWTEAIRGKQPRTPIASPGDPAASRPGRAALRRAGVEPALGRRLRLRCNP